MELVQTYRRHRQGVVTATSGLLYTIGWSIGYASTYDTASAAVLVLATIVGGYDIAKTAYHELASRTLGIKTLVTLAAIGAIAIGEYWEAAAVVFLFSLGSYLEGRTMRKTRNALQELLELAPDTALVERNGDWKEVPARDVEAGERVRIKPGAKVPVDGEVADGESAIDQSPVTGESAPVHKTPGDEVYAGTINQAGALDVAATGTGSDTTLQRIIRRVEAAQEAQAPTEQLIDRFAAYYTPAIVVLAIGAYAVTRDAMMALTLLVIGCPGALVIGPPVTIVSAIGNAARNGVLMKGGEHLETAGTIDLVAFDKTGTLTTGDPTVAGVDTFADDLSDDDVLRLAATAERRSEHHLADAILDAAETALESGADTGPDSGEGPGAVTDGGVLDHRAEDALPDPDDFTVVAGKGVRAHHDDHELLVGNRALLDEHDVEIPDPVATAVRNREGSGETAVHVVRDGVPVGVIGIVDELRDAAPGVITALRDAGVETVMLTGDNERTARAVADHLGIDDYRAELFPEEKQAAVQDFQADGQVVAMVGDGINDAPSLATADVGIAMGAAGTDTAVETADIALMADDLDRIPYAVTLSKATRTNVRQNVAIAVLTVAILLVGVLTSAVHLAGGMLVHEGSVLLVILNGMRLLRH